MNYRSSQGMNLTRDFILQRIFTRSQKRKQILQLLDMHLISASGLVLLVTSTLGTYAHNVDVIPETSCPDIQPADGASCSPPCCLSMKHAPTARFVAPKMGAHVYPRQLATVTAALLIGIVTTERGDSIPCPSTCPETPPGMFDACDIDSQFSCVFGDAVVCD